MRRSVSLLLALPVYFSAAAVLPRVGPVPRVAAADDAERPKYSVVPLEPGDDGDDQPGGGDGGDGDNGGDDDGDDVVTVIETLVKTRDPVTKSITHTRTVSEEPDTVTKAVPVPTTIISIIDMDGEETTTVFVTPTVLPPPPPPEPTTTPSTDTIVTPSSFPKPSTPTSFPPTVTLPPVNTTVTSPPTTFSTSTKAPPTPPYDNGQWHSTYPSWNVSEPLHYHH